MWKKVVSVGEEKLNQLASDVLSNENLMRSLQGFLKTALGAREQAVTTVKAGLKLINVPSLDDVKKLDQKLDELKVLFDGMSETLDSKQVDKRQ